MGSTSTDFTQGSITIGTALDVAITGEGFMMLSSSPADFSTGATKVYTRSGRFQVDLSNTYLVDPFGRKVYGYKLNENGDPVDNTLVPIQTNGKTDIGFIDGGILVSNYSEIKANSSAKPVPLYRLGLTTFQNKQGLVLADGASYSATSASGQQETPGIAGSQIGSTVSTYGNILSNSLESANIDVARVALDMNLLNRGFSATQGFIDNITKVLQGLLKIMGG
jgi:flagellar hook protein FlgE